MTVRHSAGGEGRSREIVLRFNDHINARDLDALAALMTEDHVFVDSAGAATRGKAAVVAAWRGFFAAFPDYRNDFDRLSAQGAVVTITGRSTCSFAPLHGPALWAASIREGKVAEWRVYDDVPGNRRRLGVGE